MAKRILVVDDDMMCLKTVQKYLTDNGFEVVGALSGMQAIHIIEETKVDLLLLDIEMPGLSGFSTLEDIRLLSNGKHLPTIFFTGRQDRDTVKCCAAAGAEGYITKPVEKSVLLERVEEVFSRFSIGKEEQTILIVDKDVEFLKQLKLHFNQYYKVIVISSGKSALDYLDNHSVDAIVLDSSVSVSDGEPLFSILCSTEHGQGVPMILLGEGSIAELKEQCRNGSLRTCLEKPVSAEVLLQTLQHQLSNLE